MCSEQSPSLDEVSAEIRNKLQTAKTVLEFLNDNKKVPKEYIDRAIADIEKIVKIIA